jgi:hypothetical protein
MARFHGLLLLTGVAACSSSLAVMHFPSPGQQQTTLSLDWGRDVTFWTDFDATFAGGLEARFDVELFQDTGLVAKTSCDPLRPDRVCIVHFNAGEHHRSHCRMRCSLRIPKTAPTVVRTSLILAGAPEHLRLDRADISVEQ